MWSIDDINRLRKSHKEITIRMRLKHKEYLKSVQIKKPRLVGKTV
jgi:hypothetical protein